MRPGPLVGNRDRLFQRSEVTHPRLEPRVGGCPERLLELQRLAGNAAVASLLRPPTVPLQRHKGIEADVASAHVLTDDERAELPTVEQYRDLKQERATVYQEWKVLDDQAKATTKAGAKEDPASALRRTQLAARQKEIGRLLRLRAKGDEEETLDGNGIKGGASSWFANVHSTTFLDKPVTVHDELGARLAKAEADLKSESVPPGGWIDHATSTLRDPQQGLHSFGLAIDINPGQNPFLLNPDDANSTLYEPKAQSSAVNAVIERAVLLTKARDAKTEAFFAKPDAADSDARVDATYDKLQDASDALVEYLGLLDPSKRSTLETLVIALGKNDPKGRSVDDWLKTIRADKNSIDNTAGVKGWNSPEKGLLHMDKRLVKSLTASSGAALTWLGDETVASGRDIMHFDTRGVGPIRRIYSSGSGWTYLSGGRTVQRKESPNRQGLRQGESWPGGPISQRKSVIHPLSDYISWVRALESAYGPNKEMNLQRLRRLYYSAYSGKAGAKFDQVIRDMGTDVPRANEMDAEALDRLYETDAITTPAGDTVDVSHIMAALDERVSGDSTRATLAHQVLDYPAWAGTVTWTGDLASWFIAWSSKMHELRQKPRSRTRPADERGPEDEEPDPGEETLWQQVKANKASKDDMLGDMDGQILAAKDLHPPTKDDFKKGFRGEGAGALNAPVSELLSDYYKRTQPSHEGTTDRNRFASFVTSAIPAIPHRSAEAGPSGSAIELESNAQSVIKDHIADTVTVLMSGGNESDVYWGPEAEQGLLRIAREFADFLTLGLKSGDAPWS
jgi:hypothetical protein